MKNLYLIAYTDVANDFALTLGQIGFTDTEEILAFLEANGWIDVSDTYGLMLQEDCYVYTKFENDVFRVTIHEGVYNNDNEGKADR